MLNVPVANHTDEAWDGGVAIAYQLVDPETNRVVLEGPRTPLPRVLAPGETAEVAVDLPDTPGRYRVFASAVREGTARFYEPLLVAELENGQVVRQRLTTRSALRRERLLRKAGRAFTVPLRSLWRNRRLIASMVRRDIVGRYRGSFAGLFWTVLNPALLMATYFFVFGVVLQARFGGDPSRAGFALYFLCGMLPWLAFSEAVGRAPFVVLEHGNFVKKLVFPVETLPVNLSAAGLVTEAFALAIFCVVLLLTRGGVPLAVVWLPLVLIPQVLFTVGLAWLLAGVGVYVRDLGQVIGFVLTLWFFLTPICYPQEALPAGALEILSNNPIYGFVSAYRAMFLENRAPGPLWDLWLIGAVACFAGHACFHRLKKGFADVI